MSTKKNLPAFFMSRGIAIPNPDLRSRRVVRAPKPMCPRCHERASAYPLADERGHKISEAGLCVKCMKPRVPDEHDLMLAEAAAACAHVLPASEATVLAAAAECAFYQRRANDAWHNDDMLLAELLELRARFNAMSAQWPRSSQLRELALRIDEIERDAPFLEDPDLGLPDAPPFPNAL